MFSLDLFGEVAITFRDLSLWLYLVPRLPHTSTRKAAYARGYNIVEKIRRHKLSGEIHQVFGEELCEFCGQRLEQELLHEQTFCPVSVPAEIDRLKRRVAVLEMVLIAATLPRPSRAAPGVRRSSQA